MVNQLTSRLYRLRDTVNVSARLFARTWHLLAAKGKVLFALHTVVFLSAIGLDVSLPFFLAWLIEAAAEQQSIVWWYAGLLAIGWFGVRLLEDLRLVLYLSFEQIFQRQIYQEFLDRFTKLPYDYIERFPATEHNIIVDRGVSGFRAVLYNTFFTLLPLAVRVSFLMIVVAVQIDLLLSITLTAAITFVLIATIVIGSVINSLTIRYLETYRDFFAMANESLANAITIRTYSVHDWAKSRLDGQLSKFVSQVFDTFRPTFLLGMIQGATLGGIFFVVNTSILSAYPVGAEAVPLLVLANGLTIQLAQPLLGFSAAFAEWLRGISNTTLVLDLLEQDEFLPLVRHEMHQGTDILLKDLSISYDGNQVIEKLSTTIPPVGITAIVGPSGSGKTSLAKVLAGLKQYTGQVLMPRGSTIVRYVSQNPEIFNEHLNVNIALSDELIDPTSRKDSLRKAELSANETITFPEKLGDMGSKLSGGQKSRVSLARALFSKCDVLILDEPTASLDEENALKVMNTIFNIGRAQDMTVILITHNKQFSERCDHIIDLGSK